MNFRTTIILFVLVALGLVFFIVANRSEAPKKEARNDTSLGGDPQQGRKLLELKADDVRRLVIKPATGRALELTKGDGPDWKIVQPAAWGADAMEARNLVEAVANLRSRGRVEQGAGSAKDFGLETPRYTVEITDKDQKTTTLKVGNQMALGNDLYVDADDGKGTSIAAGGELTAKLGKGTQTIFESLQDKRLVTAQATDVKQFEVTRRGAPKLVLRKVGVDWKVVEPKQVTADSGEVSSLLSVVTALRAEEFLKSDSPEAAGAMVEQPRLAVWFSGEAPSTQPTTTPATGPATKPSGTTVAFGQYADVEREKVYVKVSPEPGVLAKVNLSEWQWDRLATASPVTLRDRKVIDVDPERVEKLTVSIDKQAATQPTTRPAEKREIAIERRRGAATAPAATAPAATAPGARAGAATVPAATAPASTAPTTTTAPSTAPAAPPTKWVLASDPKAETDDAKVDTALQALHPLRATKYLETPPSGAATATYTVRVHTNAYGDQPAQVQELKLTETGAGADAKVIGYYQDRIFEAERFNLDRLTSDFVKSDEPPAPPPGLPGGFPGAPGGFPGIR